MSPKVSNKKQLQGEEISTIETKISEDILLATEALIDAEPPAIPASKADGRYEVIIEERGIRYNTVVQINKTTVKDHFCNCVTWRGEGLCQHVVAAIFGIRRELTTTKKKAAVKRKKSTGRKNVVDRLIKQVSSDELSVFIKAYSIKDRVFKLMLQARFVDQLRDDELESFIESSFPVLTKANEKVTPGKISVFLQVSEILDAQFKNYISQKDYIDGYKLNFLLLKKSFYIKSKLHTEKVKFEDTHKLLINNFLETVNLVEAPEYREYIFAQLKELLSTSYIIASTYDERRLWLTIYADKTRRTSLGKLIDAYHGHHHTDLDSAYFVSMLEILLAKEAVRNKLILEGDLQTAYRILQLLQRHREVDGALELMSAYFTIKRLSNPLAKLVLNNIVGPQSMEFIDACIAYYILYKHDFYLIWLKENVEEWSPVAARITHELQENKDSALEIQFHLANEDLECAIAAIKADNSWSLIIQFDFILFPTHPEVVLELYKIHLRAYLLDHFGLKARDFTQVIFQRAYKIGKERFRREIEAFLKADFDDRDLY